MARQAGVDPACAFGELREAHVPGGEADAGTDGGNVVQVAPEPLQLEEQRACASELGRRFEPERLLARLCVREWRRDRAGRAGALDVAQPFSERPALGGALEPSVLVEEPCVEQEDAIADEVEAEVPGLDHAGMDRSDSHLVGPVPVHGNRPARQLEVVLYERAQGRVAAERRPRRGRPPLAHPMRPPP